MTKKSQTILVTGATGYIASHAIEQLLRTTDYAVRGTVRDLKQQDKYAFLQALPNASTRLELVEANLLDPQGWKAAVKDVYAVFHIASPYTLDVKDPQKDLVDPAVKGTENVLHAVLAEDSVKHVILTSSVAAITDAPIAGHTFTETDWNTRSSLHRNPYPYSKVLAERRAWEIMETHKNKRLVVLNPTMVLGPSLNNAINESVAVIVEGINGKIPMLANISMCVVDVRDVAAAHILALKNPTMSGRCLLVSQVYSMYQLFQSVKLMFPNAKVPTATAPNFLVYVMSYFQNPGVGQFARSNVGAGDYLVDATKSKAVLGLKYLPADQTLADTVRDGLKWGHIAQTNVE